MKKRYDLSKVQNELTGASSFFKPAPSESKSDSPSPTKSAKQQQPDARSSTKQRGRDVTTSSSHDVMKSSSDGMDINQETASHDTLRLAVAETKELEAMKSSLKWDHDLTVSKNDICRVALHALLEDYQARGASSDAVKRLRKKHGR